MEYVLTSRLDNRTSAGTQLITKAPAAGKGGGITVLEANIAHGPSGGTVASSLLLEMSDATTVVGTVCSFAGTVANGAVQPGTPSGYWVTRGNYLAYANGAGTIGAGAAVMLTVVPGR